MLARTAFVAITVISSGCAKPLFPEDTPRNQYSAYDRMRNKNAPLSEPDVFGTPHPALRARLSQNQ